MLRSRIRRILRSTDKRLLAMLGEWATGLPRAPVRKIRHPAGKEQYDDSTLPLVLLACDLERFYQAKPPRPGKRWVRAAPFITYTFLRNRAKVLFRKI